MTVLSQGQITVSTSIDGKSAYVHQAWADNSTGTLNFTLVYSIGKSYTGFYSDFSEISSTDPTKYNWSLIKGEDGKNGSSSYTHLAYADNGSGTLNFSTSNSNRKYVGMYVDTVINDSTDPTKYKWSLIKGADGAQGVPGTPGVDGRTPYIHFAYANNTTGSGFSTTDSNNKLYIGTYTDFIEADSTDYRLYNWSLIKGADGAQGTPGKDGTTYYTHLAYANSYDGKTDFSTSNSDRKYIGMYVDAVPTDSTDSTKYKWTLVKGADGSQGIAGKAGADGRTPYVHFAYATNATGTTGFSTTDSTNKTYIGNYTDYTQADSTDPTKYTWSLIKGDKGDTGSQGIAGKDGTTYYTHIAYSNASDGSTDFSTSNPNRNYIGMYVDTNSQDSTKPSDYRWSLVKGADGAQGTPGKAGTDGRTPYFHTAWATNATGTAGFSTTVSSGKTYLGTYTDYISADSTDPTKYKWTLTKGIQGNQGIPGTKGADGKTPYFHTAWADSSDGRTAFSTTVSLGKKYLGTYTDFTSADSTDPSKYKWTETSNAIEQEIAYAWSPDGKDRFTRVKPGENLLVLSDTVVANINSSTGNFTQNTTPVHRAMKSLIDVKDNTKIYYTVYNPNKTINTANSARIAFHDKYGKWLSNSANIILDGTETQSSIFLIPDGTAKIRLSYIAGTANAATYDPDIKVKFEFGDKATIYTTNPQDDYDNAVPRYIGRSLKDSNDPSDYKWEPNPERKPWTVYAQGLNGEGLSLMPYGEQLLSGTTKDWGHKTSNFTGINNQIINLGTSSLGAVNANDYYLVQYKVKYTNIVSSEGKKSTIRLQGSGNKTNWSPGFPGTNVYEISGSDEKTITYKAGPITEAWLTNDYWNMYIRADYIQSGILEFKEMKIEVANTMNIPTPWTPAPTDTDENGDTGQAQLAGVPRYIGTAALPYEDPYKYTYTLNPEWVDLNNNLISQSKVDSGSYQKDKDIVWESISNRVTTEQADEIRDLAQQAIDGLNAYSDPENGQAKKNMDALDERLTGLITDLGKKVALWNFIDTWMKAGEEGFTIGNKNSNVRMLITNSRLSFISNGEEVAYFDDKQFKIKKGIILDGLRIGNHQEVSMGKDHTVTVWIDD